MLTTAASITTEGRRNHGLVMFCHKGRLLVAVNLQYVLDDHAPCEFQASQQAMSHPRDDLT